ncbi:MAG TPA: FxLYD domain-containing protein [Candidatus Obscuribacterales bacterium]
MTQPTILELAKQGDPQAIATLMNRTLHTQGMNARVARQGDRLLIMTEAAQVPNRMVMTNFVRNGINGLELDSIRLIRILGKKTGDDQAAWVQELELSEQGAAIAAPKPPASPVSDVEEATPPVIRPLPPPPPPGRMRFSGEGLAAPAQDSPERSPDVIPKRVPPPPPPHLDGLSLGRTPEQDEDDEVVDSFIPDDTTVLPSLEDDFTASELDLDLNRDEDISFDLQPASDSDADSYSESLIDDLFNTEAQTTIEDDEEISLALDDAENDLLGLSDDVLADLVGLTDPDIRPGNPPSMPEPDADVAMDHPRSSNLEQEPLMGMPPVSEPAEVDNTWEPPDAEGRTAALEAEQEQIESSSAEEPLALPPASSPAPALPEESEPQRAGVGAGSIFGVILALIIAWIGGLMGYNAWQSMNQPEGEGNGSPTAVDAPPDPEPSPDSPEGEAVETDSAYEEAIALANQANRLAANAQSQDDWALAASQWQQAVALLRSVPEDDPNYADAQAALPNYEESLAIVEQQAALPPGTESLPSTTVTISNAGTCRAVRSTQESPPLELTNVQFNAPTGNSQITYIVGCITNHTDQVIGNVSIAYQDSAGAEQIAEGRLNFNDLAPGQTIPFRSDFTLSPDTTEATIEQISWAAVGATSPQELDASIRLVR